MWERGEIGVAEPEGDIRVGMSAEMKDEFDELAGELALLFPLSWNSSSRAESKRAITAALRAVKRETIKQCAQAADKVRLKQYGNEARGAGKGPSVARDMLAAIRALLNG